MKHLLEVDDVSLSYERHRVLSDVYFHIQTGLVTGLLGSNGSGKSSLLKIAFGTLAGQSRSVRIDGKPMQALTPRIRYLSQHTFLPPHLKATACLRLFGVEEGALYRHFPELRAVFEQTRVANLSGGERRLLEIMLILLSECDFVLLDEPFAQLAPIYVDRVLEVMRSEGSRKGVLLSDHDHHRILAESDTCYLLRDGKTHPVASSDELARFGFIHA